MSGVNRKRVLLGGVVAALVVLAGEMILESLAAQGSEAWLARLGVTPPGEEAMPVILLGALLIGITAVWLYAAAMARYGAGTATALRVGIAVAVLACVAPNLGMLAYGIFTPGIFLLFTASALISVPVGTIVGARIYREPASMPAVGATAGAAARG